MSVLADLLATPESYLEVSEERYLRVLGVLPSISRINQPRAQVRFHYLRYHADERPMVRELAEELTNHLLQFCLSERQFRRPHTDHSLPELQAFERQARRLLRREKTGGEAGEMLLYFLMEAVLKAPQVVCKMELKGNPKVEVLGSDGIHLRLDSAAQLYDVFFGEAKLEKTIGAAVRSAVKSIDKFHADRRRDTEIRLVTGHFKYLDDAGKEIASRLADVEDRGAGLRTNHACLLGFNAKTFESAVGNDFRELEGKFIEAYAAVIGRLTRLIEEKFKPLAWTNARFEFFLLPFPSVETFRKEFEEAVKAEG